MALQTMSPTSNKDTQAYVSKDVDSSESSVVEDGVLQIDNGMPIIVDEDPLLKRNANWLDVLYHSITAMVGAGVLGLPAAFAHLGWVGGIIFLAFSFWVSWHTYMLLVYMHEVPDLGSKGGVRRMDRYDQLADYVWGKGRGKKILLPFQMAMLIGMGITYTVVGGESLHAFANAITPAGNATLGTWVYIIMFGGLQFLLSMLPSMHDVRLVSLLGALMSAAYCLIAVAMSASVKHTTPVNYDPAQVERSTIARIMGIFNAMTTVFFAYGGHNVALEIQATLRINERQISTVKPMMRGVNWTFFITGLCYFGVSIAGFWAFGTSVGDNVLLAFKSGPHQWVVTMASMFVVVHVAAAYQVYSQPFFGILEAPFRARRPADEPLPLWLQFGMRVVYVVITTVVALVIPFFGSLMGLVGAVAITPTTFLFPPLMWVMMKKPKRFGLDWSANWFLVWITGILGVLGTIGAVYGIVTAWSTFKIFAN